MHPDALFAQAAPVAKTGFFVVGLLLIAVVLGLLVLVFWLLLRSMRRKAARMGHATVMAYLRSTPRTEDEKVDAADLLAKGLAICVLGFLFHPLLIIGIVPLYYGCRKVGSIVAGINRSSTDDDRATKPGAGL